LIFTLLNHYRSIFLCLLLLAGLLANAQPSASTLRHKKIAASGAVRLDSFPIVPGSVMIPTLDTSYYFLDAARSVLLWKRSTGADSITIQYRVFPFLFGNTVHRFNYDSVKNNFSRKPVIYQSRGKTSNNSLIDFGNLNYNGSFGRSLSFGNSQDAVFNSQLNLQLSGMIGDSIQISAAITDNNIPIQPDGTTQQLNEFDKVWLQFKKKNWEINLGDIDVRQDNNYFLKFYKRLQGMSYQQQNNFGRNNSNKLLVSGAIAKGKFTRNIFNGLEGNQGPYRLTGANNELFFIVLAGTERVFIDGEMMQRGEDQDYVINYNTAEITFTPRRMITKDKRIQVEFEYADRNYLNYMIYGGDEISFGKKLKVTVGAYSNNDAKNSPINQTLDTQQKQFLSNIGDSVQYAFYPVATIDTFSASKILYAKRPNPLGTADSIYVYSTSPDSAKYNLNFIDVGTGNGNYMPLYNGANGKVYQWVAPVSGVKQGQFEPAAFLVTPKRQQLLAVGILYNINSKTTLRTDLALSNYDVNTFSSKDKSDNVGYGAKFFLQRMDRFKALGKTLSLNSTAGYEWVDERFKPLERLRSVEFARDWGLDLAPAAATEHLPQIGLAVRDDKNNVLQYNASGYLRSDDYRGVKQVLDYSHRIKSWQLKAYASLVNSNTPVYTGSFFRPTIDISKTFPALRNYVVGATYSLEHNVQTDKASDLLTSSSFSFDNISAYIKSDQSKNNRWSFTYFTRSNKLPYLQSLLETDRSHNYTLSGELLRNRKHQVRLNVTYRQLQVKNSQLTTLTPDNSLLGRVEYAINEWNGFLTGNALYELGTGQEQRRDYSYVEVPAGRGEYAWNDYNGDGIQQLNEFETALFPDQAKYIRVYTPTNIFVKANYTQFNYSINLTPKALSKKIHNEKFRNIITRFMLQSGMQTSKKVLATGNPEFNPFNGKISDTSLITLSNVLSNAISFNRFSSMWGADISNVRNYNKSLLTYGFETRQTIDWTFRGRANLTGNLMLEIIQKVGTNNLSTPSFDNKNYELKTLATQPVLTYTNSTKYRLQAAYQYGVKNNAVLYGGEKSTSNSMIFEGKYNAVNNTSLLGRVTYTDISFNGAANTTVSYIMLDGLLPGKNYLWTLDLTKRLGNNLELSFNYEGRKPGDSRTIHIGRASLRALL